MHFLHFLKCLQDTKLNVFVQRHSQNHTDILNYKSIKLVAKAAKTLCLSILRKKLLFPSFLARKTLSRTACTREAGPLQRFLMERSLRGIRSRVLVRATAFAMGSQAAFITQTIT